MALPKYDPKLVEKTILTFWKDKKIYESRDIEPVSHIVIIYRIGEVVAVCVIDEVIPGGTVAVGRLR